jgi:hypothetical protein
MAHAAPTLLSGVVRSFLIRRLLLLLLLLFLLLIFLLILLLPWGNVHPFPPLQQTA